MAITIRGHLVPDSEIKRFWSRVNIKSKGECWEWLGGLHSKKKWFNYGTFWVSGLTHFMTHRLALSFHLGHWVGKNNVLHSCDNPPCCNPNHLRVGSFSENMKDRSLRGRVKFQKGEDRPAAKLTEDKVRQIRRLAVFRRRSNWKRCIWNVKVLANRFGVNGCVIKKIIFRTSWKHVKD